MLRLSRYTPLARIAALDCLDFAIGRLNRLASSLRGRALKDRTKALGEKNSLRPSAIYTDPGDSKSDDELLAEALAPFRALDRLTPLAEHCDSLRYLYVSLEECRPVVARKFGEYVTWGHAAEWLHLASGVMNVFVNAGRFDDSDYMCGPAFEYNSAQSRHHSLIARELVTFNMIWGSLESAIKLADSPPVPKALCAAPKEIDRVLYGFKLAAPRHITLPLYRQVVGALIEQLQCSSLAETFRPNASLENLHHISLEGVGLQVVRRIRNSFAHGATSLDFDHNIKVPPLGIVINLSSRVALLAQQAMLLTMLDGVDDIQVFHAMRSDVSWHGATLSEAVRGLHLRQIEDDGDQLWFWPDLDLETRADFSYGVPGA